MDICCTGKERKNERRKKRERERERKKERKKERRVQNKYGAGHSESAVVNTVH